MEVSPAKSLILSATIHGGSYFFIQPPEKMPSDLLGYGGRILVDPVGNLSKIFPTADSMFNGSTISEGKVFFVSSSFRRHK